MHQININQNILKNNKEIAEYNRGVFKDHNIYVPNFMSAPGAGKTTLLERTLEHFKNKKRIGVIEGDIEKSFDVDRLQRFQIPTFQINTGGACHLDAKMIHSALSKFDLHHLDFLFIENVGNLVCPAEFDLGEHDKIMLLSVTEGDDKSKKYPLMFTESKVLILNKIDLMPYVDFKVERLVKDVRDLNPNIEIFQISCRTKKGLDKWFEWLDKRI